MDVSERAAHVCGRATLRNHKPKTRGKQMSEQMVVTITADGTVQHTLRDRFLNPVPGQRREVRRVSEILHDDNAQGFYIEWLMEPLKGKLTLGDIIKLPLGVPNTLPRNFLPGLNSTADVAMWGTYEDAVSAEIDILDYHRKNGVIFY